MVDEEEPAPDFEKIINCPKCGLSMQQIIISKPGLSVVVDRCNQCEGYWFDARELEKVLDEKTIEEGFPFEESHVNEADFGCPRCGGNVETELLYNIKIDKCLKCGGIWLDRGELGDVQREYRFHKSENKLLELLKEVMEA